MNATRRQLATESFVSALFARFPFGSDEPIVGADLVDEINTLIEYDDCLSEWIAEIHTCVGD